MITKHSTKNRIAAALFALFLGAFGAHKFYLGAYFWGIAYLLLCWTGISAILGVIEGIYYLVFDDDEDFDSRHANT